MNTETIQSKSIGEIVTDDFRAAEIFKNAGIEFCCGGNKSLDVACNERNIDVKELTLKLKELEKITSVQHHDFKNWDITFLAEYIVNTHHKYVLKTLPEIVFYTQKIADVHGDHHPELREVASLFFEINRELRQHLIQEEEVLFPAIKEVIKNNSSGAKQTIAIEIKRMNDEHEFAGGAMDKINVMTKCYKVPADGCNTYQVAFRLLEEFEDDLHTHVHLENNILYPKALLLAK